MIITPETVLKDKFVTLRPFTSADLSSIRSHVFSDEDIWRYMVTKITNQQELNEWEKAVTNGHKTSTRYTFMIVDNATGDLAGSTSYGNISWPDKRLEIGWTWLTKDFRGNGINRHCKFLLLNYAFSELGMERVELKTDVLNKRSRRAMLKIGATEEGILRSHTLMHDGRRRDTIYYSILRQEWENIKLIYFRDMLEDA